MLIYSTVMHREDTSPWIWTDGRTDGWMDMDMDMDMGTDGRMIPWDFLVLFTLLYLVYLTFIT